ncbi:hypothetical protein FQN53_002049 [Emmonsiellopsis sp. PD_33]|nr:hypothetical protein FQN53_002049 [Emmonsiellopsis sp. PD_33]
MHFKLILFPILFLGQLGHAQQKPSVWGDCDEIRKAPPDRLADLTREQIELLEKVLWPSEEMRKKFKPDEQLKRLKAAKGPEEMRIALMQYCYGNKNLKRDAPRARFTKADCDSLRTGTPEQVRQSLQAAEDEVRSQDRSAMSDKKIAFVDHKLKWIDEVQKLPAEKIQEILFREYCTPDKIAMDHTSGGKTGTDVMSTMFKSAMDMAMKATCAELKKKGFECPEGKTKRSPVDGSDNLSTGIETAIDTALKAACPEFKKNGLECPFEGNAKRDAPSVPAQTPDKKSKCDLVKTATPDQLKEVFQPAENIVKKIDRNALSDKDKADLDKWLKTIDKAKTGTEPMRQFLLDICEGINPTKARRDSPDIITTAFTTGKTKRDAPSVPAQTPAKKAECDFYTKATPEQIRSKLQEIENEAKKIDRNALSDKEKAIHDEALKVIDEMQTYSPEQFKETVRAYCAPGGKIRRIRRGDIISTAFSTAMEMAKNAAAACMELKKKGLKCNEDEKSIVRDN